METVNSSARLIERIRPDSGLSEPVYKQLFRRITDMIQSGEIGHGHSLPSERALAVALDLSRTTVRRCYEELRSQNHVNTHGRAGITVNAPLNAKRETDKLKCFTQEIQELGLTPSIQLLEHDIITDRTVASLFNRPATTRFLRLLRLHLGNNTPITRQMVWYDLFLAPSMEKWDFTGSAYQFLKQHCGLELAYCEQAVEAVLCNNEEAAVFGFEQPSPCLLFKRKTYSASGQIVEYLESTFRGDVYAYRNTFKVNTSADMQC